MATSRRWASLGMAAMVRRCTSCWLMPGTTASGTPVSVRMLWRAFESEKKPSAAGAAEEEVVVVDTGMAAGLGAGGWTVAGAVVVVAIVTALVGGTGEAAVFVVLGGVWRESVVVGAINQSSSRQRLLLRLPRLDHPSHTSCRAKAMVLVDGFFSRAMCCAAAGSRSRDWSVIVCVYGSPRPFCAAPWRESWPSLAAPSASAWPWRH